LQIVRLFTNAYRMNRQAKFLGQCHNNSALGRTIQLGDNKPSHIGNLAKGLDLTDRILADSAIQNNHRIMRCRFI
jgi:hypothetical protein